MQVPREVQKKKKKKKKQVLHSSKEQSKQWGAYLASKTNTRISFRKGGETQAGSEHG